MNPSHALPPQEISLDVLQEKYAKNGEADLDAIRSRVARALASVEAAPRRAEFEATFKAALEQGFIPAGRIWSAAGAGIQATLMNCFVQPVGDCIQGMQDGKPGIYTALQEAAETMRRGGGVGYDFSRIRPAGARVKGTASSASGPISFMKVFDASCETVESAGARRGAQMGVLRCDHPDIEAFIHAKDGGAFRNFNLSIGVTDAFMQAVDEDASVELVHRVEPSAAQKTAQTRQRPDGMWVYRVVRARDLWDQVMRSTYDHAEPGILFIDRMNAENNLAYCETIEATNPCAEQPLPDYGCCDLGSIDLTRFVRDPFTSYASFDDVGFERICATAVRMLDNVLDLSFWPLEKQRQEAMIKRRIGLGFLGLGDACIMMGLRYDEDDARQFAAEVARRMRDAAYGASCDLAAEKGPFPLFNAENYLKGPFAQRLPEALQAKIEANCLRNSHLLSIAPTGTISLAFADNASNGIEPAFSWVYSRKKRLADGGTREYEVADHAWRLHRAMGGVMDPLPRAFVTALEMSADAHMRMLEAVQPYIDTSISKTVNVPEDSPYEDFKDLYMNGWKAGLKGLATYRPNAVLGAVLSVPVAPGQTPAKTVEPDVDPLTVRWDGRPMGDLHAVTTKIRTLSYDGVKDVYVSVSFATVEGRIDGEPVRIERPIEFFMPAGQRDEGQQWISSSMRMLSLMARSGGPIAKALQNMRDVVWDKGSVRCGVIERDDGSTAPRFHDSEAAAIAFELQALLRRRGFLDADGQQVSARVLSARFERSLADPTPITRMGESAKEVDPLSQGPLPNGKQCPECGGYFLHKVDGCEKCASCGHVGMCG